MVKLIRSDLDFILQQILIAEQEAAGASLDSLLPNSVVPFGLRTLTGALNHVFPGQTNFGAADTLFPRMLTPAFRVAEGRPVGFFGPLDPGDPTPTTYAQVTGNVFDSQPRTISNLIVDQTASNPAAYSRAYDPGLNGVLDFDAWTNPLSDDVLKDGVQVINGTRADGTPFQTFEFSNLTPDEGLSAPFNAWMTFFGQFFDHGLDLVTKGGNNTIYIPLQPDDPLYVEGGFTNFMAVTRATQFNGPGPDGVLGDDPSTAADESLDDTTHEGENTTSPFVDQNQTYASHPAHQVFLRAYEMRDVDPGVGVDLRPFATGKLIEGALGGMSTWADVKAQAAAMLGIQLTDTDVFNVPLLRTDAFGKFIPGPNGFAQVITGAGADGIFNTADDIVIEGDPAANGGLGISLATAVRTGHAFLNDIAHNAVPGTVFDTDGNPATPGTSVVAPDDDNIAGNAIAVDFMGRKVAYDDELLNAHFMAGDGRVNENIGLTAVHAIFHAEHNRLVEHTKDVALADAQALLAGGATQAEAVAFLNQWLAVPISDLTGVTKEALTWNGERLFQAAKFGTEMQYQHLVFEEFARRVQPMVDAFLAPEGFDTMINPAIVAEFAHTVYRFGHSMLTETVDRFDPNFNLVNGETSQIGLIQAFLNPLAFVASGATSLEATGALARGLTRTQGNEIDEFVTEALRNNLVGLPLDLPSINLARGRDTGVPSLNAARREFYAMTSDSQLKPYTSWADFSEHLKHFDSLLNFIAAYGAHVSITSATTLADKRAAAYALVYGEGGLDGDVLTLGDNPTVPVPADRLEFLYSTGAYANLATGETITGVDAIDLWIGGLAEEQMPFGGLLGSTFNFVFETQMESLQNGDRFYYLARLAGLNLLTEMENNSFAKLVMRNSDATHLPAEIFTTPGFILEVDPTRQFTGLGLDGRADPTGDSALIPLVIRDNPATLGPDADYLRYNGPDHVVLGGTPGNDVMISSEGDDTIWGDAGNDIIEGGDGVDNIEGGDGDDIITDKGGDDILKGNAGNDVIQGGNGFNLLLGGDGSDFIITGEDVSETFGGTGNDFILGAQMNLPTFGNEGDDWIEIGTSDGAGGDNFDPQEASTVIGHDVFITGGGFDEVDGEGGDDIMVLSDGEDHFAGGGGFDWASYANDPFGVTADLLVNDLFEPPVTPSNQGILDRFAEVEGLSGSSFSDVLRGDDADAAEIGVAGALNGELTRIALIAGLQELLGAGVTSFGSGNIILGGDGSDIIEGRGGDDLIDGDRSINVRISVRAGFDANGPVGAEIATFDSMSDPTLLMNMLNGTWNPGQLQIVREILTAPGPDFDTAVFSGVQAEYIITDLGDGRWRVQDTVARRDGTDTLQNIERLQFSPTGIDPGTVILTPGLNNEPVGSIAIDDTTPSVNQVLTADASLVTDADNPGGTVAGPITFIWQVERDPVNAPGHFTDIVALGGGNPETVHGNTLRVSADLNGLALRVKAIYQDANGTLETVFSTPTAPVAGVIPVAPAGAIPTETIVASPGNGLHLIRADMQFILDQIKIAEAHLDGNVLSSIANSRLPFGLRTVDGSFNNLVQGQTNFGASDQDFVLQLVQQFRIEQDGDTFDANGPAPGGLVTNNNYASTTSVADADPRIISNLISDQTATNLSAAIANGTAQTVLSPGLDGIFGTADDREVFFIPNTTPDVGLSAPFNVWFVFFGQFFDHGLDLVDKGGNGTVFIPLEADDPLIAGANGIFGDADDLPAAQRFMAVTRATNSSVSPGPDGILGTPDDVHTHNNETTPFVDQNQTYTSHPSHQVFLREYVLDGTGKPVATGRLIDGLSGIGNWAEVKAQSAAMLGIQLTDMNIFDVPMLLTDAYGRFIPGPNGFAQFITATGLVEANPADNGGLGTLVPANALFSGHAFLNDIAHNAVPGTVFDTDGNPATPGTSVVAPDADNVAGNAIAVDFAGRKVAYDDELLNEHVITGDGRGNENIGLTAVHFIFHAEHNRMVGHLKDVAIASNDIAFLNEWLLTPVAALPANQAEIDALVWNGERLFQAARFATEMQYQHLVFEEFARKIQPQVDVFLMEGQGYDATINPAIVAEFAHVVYRFGHSMLTETIDRFDPSFNVVSADPLHPGQTGQIGLIAAFLNPLAFAASATDLDPTPAEAAGAIIRGITRQPGNEIDEFVTEALRNNLVGLPLDLPAINLARGRDTGVPTLNQARVEFYAMTGDSQLKPYTSWFDFAMNLKHVESLVNFIAAYGTHASITGAATNADRRAAAYALVYGENGMDGVAASGDEPTVAVPADRLDFLFATGAYAPDGDGPNDDSLGGLNRVDLWIGGLAEKQMPFGGLLGSTFNFVFETQMEKLQNGDRFYYLERTAGLNFLTELENNSFAKLIMANTDAKHLPGDVFSTPTWILEADQSVQYTGLGLDGRADPTEGGTVLTPLVVRGLNLLRYTGVDHVVLGGTSADETLIASIGDDTLYGDGGNDRLDGGYGVDIVFGGAGDDIITDLGGDDNLQGQDGNDAIHGGNGVNLILGGFGNDFIVTGEDESEAFGGPGNDFIFGIKPVEMIFGNEGDDWIEHGMADGSAGENFDTRGLDSIIGNDVFMGDTVSDRMLGEGGDDIMLGNGGTVDRYIGSSGFDWASFDHPTLAGVADLNLRAFDETRVPLSPSSVLARFESVEGLSGSKFGDILRGDDADATVIAASGFTGSVLTNIALIGGLQTFLDDMIGDGVTPVASFGAGNIILGGDGSDVIEGRGGNDLIDGDLALSVRISVRENTDGTGAEIGSARSMTELQADVFAGNINPGQLVIVREILAPTTPGPDFDTAVFANALFDPATGLANYEIRVNGVLQDLGAGPIGTPFTIVAGDLVTVTDVSVRAVDGTDTLRNIERLQFADQALVISGVNAAPVGQPTISGIVQEDQILTVSIALVTDADNVTLANPTGAITGAVTFYWQVEARAGSGVFEDIINATGLGDVHVTGVNFTPTDAESGLRLRVRAVYQDGNGVIEQVFSEPTDIVTNINDNATGVPVLSDSSPTEGVEVVAIVTSIADADGLTAPNFTFQWQQSVNAGATWTDIVGADGPGFTPTQAQVGLIIRVRVQFTDDGGNLETLFSAPSGGVGDLINGNAQGNILNGTPFDDFILGNGGGDTLNGLAGDDILDGGAGGDTLNGGLNNDTLTGGAGADTLNGDQDNDTLTGGAGADTINGGDGDDVIIYAFGDGADTMDGGLGTDTLTITGTPGNDVLDVTFNGASLSVIEGGSATGIELVNADLQAGDDTLNFAATAAAVSIAVNLAAGTASGFASILGIENVIGGAGADSIVGGVGANALTGGGGADSVDGGAGADILAASLNDGDDAYLGGLGFDRYVLSNTTAGATVNLALGTSTSAQTGSDTIAGVEGVLGSAGSDVITGDGLANVLEGAAGADTLNGGAGADTLIGGAGSDTINGDAGNDLIVFTFGDGADVLYDGGGDIDTVSITGTPGNNNLTVQWGGAALLSFNGVALLNIEAVAANLVAGVDTLSYAGTLAAFPVTVNLGTGTASGFASIAGIENVTGGQGGDTLTGDANANTLNGGAGAGADTLNGGAGNDTLQGGGGADVLNGGADNDTLNGGAGNDRFVFTNGFGADTVIGFDENPAGGQDLLDISALGVSAATFAASVIIAQVGADVVITINGDTITLSNENAANYSAADFILA